MSSAPVIRTERLILRLPKLEDWPSFAEVMMSDRAKYMGGPYSEAQTWGSFCHGIAGWSLFGVGNLSIERLDTKRCIGQIEINQGPKFPEPELGWQLVVEAERMGYAYESAVALRDWAFKERGLTSLVSYMDPDNARSKNLALRLGAVLDKDAPKQDPGDLVFRHLPGNS